MADDFDDEDVEEPEEIVDLTFMGQHVRFPADKRTTAIIVGIVGTVIVICTYIVFVLAPTETTQEFWQALSGESGKPVPTTSKGDPP